MKISKYLFSLLVLCVSTFSLLAQKSVPEDISKTGSRDRVVFELNWNGWLDKPDSIETKWYGRGINLYAFYDFKLGKQDFVSFGLGGGISNNNVYHRSVIGLQDIDTTDVSNIITTFTPIAENINVRTNKISTTYLEVPLELRFRTKPDKFGKRFKVNPNIRLGYLLSGYNKYRGDDADGRDIKVKDYLLPNINKFRVSAGVRVGYGNISLVSSFALSSLFEKDKGPGLKAFSIGVSFNSF